jgi:hypothetical protein
MNGLSFEIKTLEYSDPVSDLQLGDEVHIENVIDGECFTAEGVIDFVFENDCTVEFMDKFGEKRVRTFEKKHIYPKKKSLELKWVTSFAAYNCILIVLNNDTFHLVDLDYPDVVKYKFDVSILKGEVYGNWHMISPTHCLHYPRYYNCFGNGCIFDMTGCSKPVMLKRSETTQKCGENCHGRDTIHLLKDNCLYLSNGLRVVVFDTISGEETYGWDLGTKNCEPSLSLLNGHVFTNSRTHIWRLPNDFTDSPILIGVPVPQRAIYTDKCRIISKFFDDLRINPRKELLLDVYYGFDIDNWILSHEEILDLLRVLEQGDLKKFPKVVIGKIKERFAEWRKKYPDLKIVFKNKEIESIASQVDFQSIMEWSYVTRGYPRYVHTDDISEYYLQPVEGKRTVGLKHNRTKETVEMLLECGASTNDTYVDILFPEKRYEEVTKEMLIRFTLCQTLVKMVKDIARVIKYEDANGLPLKFSEYFSFDGIEFIHKEYSKDVSLWRYDDGLKVGETKINIDGEEIPGWGDWDHEYPKTEVQSKFHIETVTMPYYQAEKLESIRGPSEERNRKRPSEQGWLIHGLTKISERNRYEDQTVKSFVWKENGVNIRIPLAFYPRGGIMNKHGRWVNTSYVINTPEYVKIVHVKM